MTSSPAGFYSFAGDITQMADSSFLNQMGTLDTQNPRNADGNREIFHV